MSLKPTNPKDIAAVDRLPLDLLPPVALAEVARVLQHGAVKYGRFNWREAGVKPEVYLGAMLRHLMQWASGEDMDPDSGMHHLAHVMASCCIVLDAEAHDKLEPWEDLSRPKMLADYFRSI